MRGLKINKGWLILESVQRANLNRLPRPGAALRRVSFWLFHR
jgi:hypothetical protein